MQVQEQVTPAAFLQGMKDGAESFHLDADSPTLQDVISHIHFLFSPRAKAVEKITQQTVGGDLPTDAYRVGFITSWLNCYASSIC